MTKPDSPIAWARKYIATDARHASSEPRDAAKALLACVEALENLSGIALSPIGRRKLGLSPDDERVTNTLAAISLAKGEDQT